jgi:hypothetical protein
MESHETATVPAQSPANAKGRDFEPVPSTAQIEPIDDASGPQKPYDIDSSDSSQEDGKPHR